MTAIAYFFLVHNSGWWGTRRTRNTAGVFLAVILALRVPTQREDLTGVSLLAINTELSDFGWECVLVDSTSTSSLLHCQHRFSCVTIVKTFLCHHQIQLLAESIR